MIWEDSWDLEGEREFVVFEVEGIEEFGCVRLFIREGGFVKKNFIYKLK